MSTQRFIATLLFALATALGAGAPLGAVSVYAALGAGAAAFAAILGSSYLLQRRSDRRADAELAPPPSIGSDKPRPPSSTLNALVLVVALATPSCKELGFLLPILSDFFRNAQHDTLILDRASEMARGNPAAEAAVEAAREALREAIAEADDEKSAAELDASLEPFRAKWPEVLTALDGHVGTMSTQAVDAEDLPEPLCLRPLEAP